MSIAYLALGTNLGDKKLNLENAQQLIAERIGNLSAVSSVYETEPWGYESKNTFLNEVIKVETELLPFRLLSVTMEIEIEMGRENKTTEEYEDRIIDIDILLYDELVLESQSLILPHPLMHTRKFVLDPLREIAPELIHPVLGIPIKNIS